MIMTMTASRQPEWKIGIARELTRCIKFRSQTTNMMKIGLHTSQAEELSIMTKYSSQT